MWSLLPDEMDSSGTREYPGRLLAIGCLGVIFLWCVVALPGCASMAPTRSPPVDIIHYEVYGETTAALLTSLKRERSHAVPGGEHDGYTRWHMTWQFFLDSLDDLDDLDGECRLTGTWTRLSTQVYLPHWSMPSDPAPGLVDKWSRYISALAAHEEGHIQIARDAEAAVRLAASEVPPARSCSTLRKQLESTARQTIEEFKKREREYDRATNHGSTRGARFH